MRLVCSVNPHDDGEIFSDSVLLKERETDNGRIELRQLILQSVQPRQRQCVR